MKLYNTLSGRKEDFSPRGDTVKMYVCGVTPYDKCHLGHAMSYITFDILRRYLEFRGYKVRHVQNFTDIDDKIIRRARELGIPPLELAEGHIASYFQETASLNIKQAHIYPRATQEIGEMLKVIQGLIEKGLAYEAGGDVYFRVTAFPGYGKLSRRPLEEMLPGARVEVGEAKEHPLDFALWKGAKPGEPSWSSPWGEGRPGWHIECTAMSLRYLGESLDIHGGGQDLIFPHHENEIAQSEAFTGVVPFARFWVHNGLMQFREEKMSKSLGNIVTLEEALSRYHPDAIRIFVLSSHYRGPLSYSDEGLEAMERGAERLRQAVQGDGGKGSPLDPSPEREKFMAAMEDDLNTPQALAALFDLARRINRGREEGASLALAVSTLRELADVLGLTLEEKRVEAPGGEAFIQLLAEVREELRKSQHWALADRIRSRLRELGVALEDTPQGPRWRFHSPEKGERKE